MFLLPFTALMLILGITMCRNGSIVRGIVNGWLYFTAIVWGTTELFSLFHGWNKISVAVTWFIAIFVCGYIIFRLKIIINIHELPRRGNAYRQIWESNKGYLRTFLIFGIIVLGLATLRSQSNVDSMVYHLPRIMHWIQNKSVGHYAAGRDLQIRYPALSEYLVAQILILGGSDRLANLVQTGAYFASAMVVYGISRRLAVQRKTAFFAALIYLFTPMALAQSFTTQTDDIAGLFLLVFVYQILDFIRQDKLIMDRKGLLTGIRLAANVMFGYLCKPTVCFAMVVFFLWMCVVRIIKKDSILVLTKYVVVGIITAGIIYMPLCYKSYQTYIRPYQVEKQTQNGKESDEKLEEDALLYEAANALAPDNANVVDAITDIKEFMMVCVQNLARNSTSACFPKWNEWIESGVNRFAQMIGKSAAKFSVPKGRLFTYSDTATNPITMFLTLGMVICLVFRISRPQKEQLVFIICAIVSLIIQCGFMGYTPYRTRYLVGVMAVLCVAVAVTVDSMKVTEMTKVNISIFLIAISTINVVNILSYETSNVRESFRGGSDHQYFVENTEYEYAYSQMMEHINNNQYTRIGIDGGVYYEYILWACIDNLQRLENVNLVNSAFGIYEDRTYEPECIIKTNADGMKQGEILRCHGVEYMCEWSISDGMTVYSVCIPVD